MNKRQARRIALAVEASYLLFGADTDCVVQLLSEADARRFRDAQREMALEMLRKAGFEEPMQADEIVRIVLGQA